MWEPGQEEHFSVDLPVIRRAGVQFIAQFDKHIHDLRIRRGRLTVKDNDGVTHIVPMPRDE